LVILDYQLLEYHRTSMRINEDIWKTGEKVVRALSVAGSDSGGCAGIQADLRTFFSLGVHGMTAITGITAQNTCRVQEIFNIPPGMVASQIDAVMTDIGADAVKTGMLSDPETISVVAEKLREYGIRKVVVDPVMVSTGGDELISGTASEILVRELFPLALIVTPNLDEASSLIRRPIRTMEDMHSAARELLAFGPGAVLIKGGHLRDSGDSVDLLFEGEEFIEFSAPRIDTLNTHGSGCTLAAAIAAFLARGSSLREAVSRAKEYVTGAIRNSYSLGSGNGPLGHFYRERGDS
jgi:hydroxymethylpyrimidine/phosphomethylpyrimidine kinase